MSARGLIARTAGALASDLRNWGRRLRGQEVGPSEPALSRGLRTYRLIRNGGRSRLHLRVSEDGSGLLFADVTDTVALSPTAAEMAVLILEGPPEQEALAGLRRRYRNVSMKELTEHYRALGKVIDKLSDPRLSCRTCSLELPRTPLFSTKVSAPYKVDLALTYACNNACPHCYNEAGRFDLRSLSAGEWKAVIDKLARAGVPHLIFTGGEPTLHPHLEELIAHAERWGQITGLNTNGRRLQDASLVRNLVEAGLDHVQITLLSHSGEVHDRMVGAKAFDETVAGIRRALEADLHVITNTTLTQVTAGHAEQTVRFLHSLGLKRFAMNGIIHAGGGHRSPQALSPERLAAVLVQVREVAEELGMGFLWYTVTRYCELSPLELEIGAKRCNAAEYSMCIEPSGDVLPCQSWYQSAGNILTDPWESFWQGDLFRRIRERSNSPQAAGLPDGCASCPDLCVCGGGCPLERKAQSCTETSLGCSRRPAEERAAGCRGGRSRGSSGPAAGRGAETFSGAVEDEVDACS